MKKKSTKPWRAAAVATLAALCLGLMTSCRSGPVNRLYPVMPEDLQPVTAGSTITHGTNVYHVVTNGWFVANWYVENCLKAAIGR